MQELIKIKPKTSELLFLVTGIGMLLTLPWMEIGGFKLWFFLKGFYFTGIVVFFLERIHELRLLKQNGNNQIK